LPHLQPDRCAPRLGCIGKLAERSLADGELGGRSLHYPTKHTASGHKRERFRNDVEGLRAVAVLGVVLYHAHVGVLSGGFAGVDVFFVVSGYLITGLLWAELRRDGRISLAGFYARRARRLLPASILVVLATVAASRVLLPPLAVPSTAKDGLASALYVGNYRFAFQQTDYLNASGPPSPFQHYWSLGVEEQFYLLWPLLLIIGSLVWRRTRSGRSRSPDGFTADGFTAALTLAVLTGGSYALSLWLTRANQPWAFFSLPTRAWELGLGGLLALSAPAIRSIPRRAADALGWAGLATLVSSFFLIGSSTPFPGTAALAPVLGTAAVIAAGTVRGAGPTGLLSSTPTRFVGRISYSWYLWHWPFLVLAPDLVGHPLGLAANLFVALLSGAVAIVSFLIVESPARASAWLSAFARRSLITGGTLSAGGAVACLAIGATVPSVTGHGTAPIAMIQQSRYSTPVTTVDPQQSLIKSLDSQINSQVSASLQRADVPANLQPTLGHAHHDDPPVFYDGCMDSYLDSTVKSCAFGNVTSQNSVVLFGDSHAAMWFPALDSAADQIGWKLYNWTKATCPPIEIPIVSPVLGRNFTECEAWRQTVLQRIGQIHPAVVALGVARHYTSIYGFTPYEQPWLDGMKQMISEISRLGSKVVVIGAIPKPPFLVPQCLSEHLTSDSQCTEPEANVVNLAGVASEEAAVRSAGGTYIDALPWFCANGTCGAIVGNIEIWRDDNHITATYSSFLGPVMAAYLKAASPG
jgi:peptidoglycan/LPS O-acetylase OafA/YrhL